MTNIISQKRKCLFYFLKRVNFKQLTVIVSTSVVFIVCKHYLFYFPLLKRESGGNINDQDDKRKCNEEIYSIQSWKCVHFLSLLLHPWSSRYSELGTSSPHISRRCVFHGKGTYVSRKYRISKQSCLEIFLVVP